MKLEEIERKNIFEVPDGYFDRLPLAIQKRVERKKRESFFSPVFIYNLKYALPVLVIGITSMFIYTNYYQQATPVTLLESVNTEVLIAYLDESDVSEEEIIESIGGYQLNFNDASHEALDATDISKMDLDKLSKEIENEYF
jgi:hypothetical protein